MYYVLYFILFYIMFIIFYINFAGKLRKLIMTPLTPIGQGRDYQNRESSILEPGVSSIPEAWESSFPKPSGLQILLIGNSSKPGK